MQCSDEGYGQWQETMVAWPWSWGMHLVRLSVRHWRAATINMTEKDTND